MCLTNIEHKLMDNLNRPLEIDTVNRNLWNDKCDYINIEDCNNLNPENFNFIVMQHNIRGLLTNQGNLKHLLNCLQKKNSSVDIVLLCETHLTTHNAGLVNIPGYVHVANYRTLYKGGGTSILIRNGIPFKRRKDLEIFIDKEIESTYIEITAKSGKHFIIGSLYRPPNTNVEPTVSHIREMLTKNSKTKKEIILGLDHNLDLLKSEQHHPTQRFFDTLLENKMLPTITRPTRITTNSATLIDNIFISENLQNKFDSCILIDDMSDHLPILTLLKQTKLVDKSPLIYQSRRLTDDKINTIKNLLREADWNGILNNDDSSVNFDKFNNTLATIMDSIAPIVTIRISGRRKFAEPWMSTGIETSTRKCHHLYKATLKPNSTGEQRQKYKEYRNTLNRIKR